MPTITFIDAEINFDGKIKDLGAISTSKPDFHEKSVIAFGNYLAGSDFICGHNIIQHDLQYLNQAIKIAGILDSSVIDTLYSSPLLFPNRPYHRLLKDEKLQTDEKNNPVNDAKKAKELFDEEIAAFHALKPELQRIYVLLLANTPLFQGFFNYLGEKTPKAESGNLIKQVFEKSICSNASIRQFAAESPIELAYALALIGTDDKHSITPSWVLHQFPKTESILNALRAKQCVTGCHYCDRQLSVLGGLKEFFGFDAFRSYGGKPLQEQAAQAAIDGKSLLAVFPTGGGKSITFQVPALMSGRNERALTVIISPLLSLMKDQVDNLEKNEIVSGVTINGLLDPIARAEAIERVSDGTATLLYIAPEMLRSNTIRRLLLGRKIARFVIDEAHCLSSWGQDFRVDYLYIADFIKELQEQKRLTEPIPISCFTATARTRVIEDICKYFHEKLQLELQVFTAASKRENLHYHIWGKETEAEKYEKIRELISEKDCPTIVYVSKTAKAVDIANKLQSNGYDALPFHGKLDPDIKTKNQNAFLTGQVPIMVATSAFGMGVDKSDIGLVIHHDISDSLENYVQEAGRAGRNQNMEAECHILFSEEDLSGHFIRLNQQRLSVKDIQQVWRAIKNLSGTKSKIHRSALEIARKAGWDDTMDDIETKVKTAIAVLEDSGYVQRRQNWPHVYASSILSDNANEAIQKIKDSGKFDDKYQQYAERIIRKLFSSRSRQRATEEAGESRVDYIADHLGIPREAVIYTIELLKQINVLANTQDLTVNFRKGESKSKSLEQLNAVIKLEQFMLNSLGEEYQVINLKELNEQALSDGCSGSSVSKIRTLLNFWVIRHWAKRKRIDHEYYVGLQLTSSFQHLKELFGKRHELARFILVYLHDKNQQTADKEETEIEFSLYRLKAEFCGAFEDAATLKEVQDALLFLSRIEALRIDGGFLVLYNRLQLERIEMDNRIQYKTDDYRKLKQHYSNKVEQIHVVGEYAKKMITNYQSALQFVDDYFRLQHSSFLQKYFPGSRKDDLQLNITPAKFRKIFGQLDPTQLEIVKDSESKNVVVAAGPGSGKTRVLVHKLASLLLMEDVKHEQLLMLTFSRAAATEFRKRLKKLIGKTTYFIDIKTFHSFCFDLSGKIGTLSKSDNIIADTVEAIHTGEVEPQYLTRTVLVIDEAQDMNEHELALVKALMHFNDDLRVVAVGDDDQTIYEFRGANPEHLNQFVQEQQARTYELVTNYRSYANLVEFTNIFASGISRRLKHLPIQAFNKENGTIHITRYLNSEKLITPLVQTVVNFERHGSTAILTQTNEDALIVAAALRRCKLPVRLIQGNDSINLYDIQEIRLFHDLVMENTDAIITEENWERAKRIVHARFHGSSKYEICEGLISTFEQQYEKIRYKSDLGSFVRDSKPEDFLTFQHDTIVVSTMHKAKGKEFDNVFVMLKRYDIRSDANKRLVYVAMTRAKQHLHIHLNEGYLDKIKVAGLMHSFDEGVYDSPDELVFHLGYNDVVLDHFLDKDEYFSQYTAGQKLMINNSKIVDGHGNVLIRFSKDFSERLEPYQKRGYRLSKASVNYVAYWRKKDTDIETRVILPELRLTR